jgi:hypothetical protein
MATKKTTDKKKTVKVTHPAHPEHSKLQSILAALSKVAEIAPAVVELSGVDAEDTAKAKRLSLLTTAITGSLKK